MRQRTAIATKWLFLMLTLALTLGTATVASSSVADMKVGKKAYVILPENVRVGNVLLQGRRYMVQCDHKSAEEHEMVFRRMTKQNPYYPRGAQGTDDVTRVPCHVHPLYVKNDQTAVYINKDGAQPSVSKIVVRGENVEHRFTE